LGPICPYATKGTLHNLSNTLSVTAVNALSQQ